MSLSKTNLLPKSAGNTEEAVAPSQHDCKIVYRDVKNQMNQTNQQNTKHISCQVYQWVQTIRTYFLHNRVLDGSWNSKFNEAFNTSFAHIKNDLLTLMQSYKRTPNTFYASSSKSKNQSCILSIFINKPSLCRGSKRYFISKRLVRLARTKSQ